MGSGLGSGEIKVSCCPCRVPCTSVQLWQGTIAAGYGNGQVRLYEASTGTLHIQINAHARAICALDLAPDVGKVSPTSSHSQCWDTERNSTSLFLLLDVAPAPGT